MPFILDRPKASEPTFIFLFIYLHDGRLKYPVKEKCHPKQWNGKRTSNKTTNLILNRIENKIAELTTEYKVRNLPLTKATVKLQLDIMLHRSREVTNFWEAVDDIINSRASGTELTANGKKFSAYTIRNYRNTRNLLKSFDRNLSFDNITMQTYDRLVSYSNSLDHSTNMVGQTIKNLKVFLKAAKKMGAYSGSIHDSFKIPDEQTFDIYLTLQEIDLMYRLKLPNKKLELARDWFIIDCFTGLRISDIKNLGDQNFNGDLIQLYNEKTDTRVVVPLHPCVKAILKKHKGLPRKISDQKMNEYIKEVAFKARIRSKILFSITKGGVRKDEHLQKWQMVSNHTARRSFITNLLKSGESQLDVMKLAGLKKLSTMQRYFKESEEEIAERMKGKKFFK